MFSGVVCALAALTASSGELSVGSCWAEWRQNRLVLSNETFRREYQLSGNALQTVSLVRDGTEFVRVPELAEPTADVSFSAKRAKYDFVGVDGLRVDVAIGTVTNAYWVLPGVPGVVMSTSDVRHGPSGGFFRGDQSDRRVAAERHYAVGADRLFPQGGHVRVTVYDFADQTDYSEELLQTREWLLTMREHPLAIRANVLSAENAETGSGLVFVRLSPLPDSRVSQVPDFIVSGRDCRRCCACNSVTPVATGFPVAELAYGGGEFGRIRALRQLERAFRVYVPGRDGQFQSNTWGGDNGDSRICEAFLQKEIEAAAELGVDVVQVDDGWQKGRSANSRDPAKGAGAWGNFRSRDPDFWLPCPKRLPHGLAGLTEAARRHGLRLGLWYGPDSTDDASRWQEDADCLLSLWKVNGIHFFKIDSLSTLSQTAFLNQRRFFDKVLELSGGEVVFDLDVTAHERPGYFGLPYLGPIFVENRYTSDAGWWPHHTLRNLWSLSKAVDPVRLRIEVGDPLKHRERYRVLHGDDQLLPEKWRGDAVFAIAMMASPLGWFEVSELEPRTVSEMKPLVARWKMERARLHGGTIYPVAGRPDGFSWTGFASVAEDGGGSVLLFREASNDASFVLPLKGLFPVGVSARVIGGHGSAACREGCLAVTVPEKLDFIWIRIEAER